MSKSVLVSFALAYQPYNPSSGLSAERSATLHHKGERDAILAHNGIKGLRQELITTASSVKLMERKHKET